jgi:bifunctional DNase/RNase
MGGRGPIGQGKTAELEPAPGKSVEQIYWRASDAVNLASRADVPVEAGDALAAKQGISAEQARSGCEFA